MIRSSGPRRGAGRLFAALSLVCLSAGGGRAQTPAQAPVTAPAPAPAEGPKPYVDGFCLPIAGGYIDDIDTSRFLKEWDARPVAASEADAARPVDAPSPGQRIRFSDADAPEAFLDARRGVCSLIWAGPVAAPSALKALAEDRPPVGAGGAPVAWARVQPAFGKPQRPVKYLLRLRGAEDRGVCASRYDDLRLRDGSAVTMLQLAPCRLASGEKVADE